jgi:hypothetical protein
MAVLWALAVLAAGALTGFLFGIPRVLQNDPGSVVRETPEHEHTERVQRPVYRMQVNTNLEQISDWLTKIIVGFGLIELRNVPDHLNRLTLFIAKGLGDLPQAQALAIALVLYFFVVGFLGGYLMTRIYLAQAFSRADWGAQNTIVVAGEELTASEVSEQSRTLLADLQDQILNLQKALPSSAARGYDSERTISSIQVQTRLRNSEMRQKSWEPPASPRRPRSCFGLYKSRCLANPRSLEQVVDVHPEYERSSRFVQLPIGIEGVAGGEVHVDQTETNTAADAIAKAIRAG